MNMNEDIKQKSAPPILEKFGSCINPDWVDWILTQIMTGEIKEDAKEAD